MPARTGQLAWLAAIVALVLLAIPAAGEPPEDARWGSTTIPGDPVGTGFLSGGFIAYATSNSPGPLGGDGAPCADADAGADLYLFTYPNGTGCTQALDAAGGDGGATATALTTAERAGRVILGVHNPAPPVGGEESTQVKAFDLDEAALEPAFTRSTPGRVLDLDADARGQRAAATIEADTGSYRLTVYAPDGSRSLNERLPDQVQAVDVSANARYVAVGGNLTTNGTSFGWVQVYDLGAEDPEDPIIDRELERVNGGVVTSVAVTDDGRVFAGSQDGIVTYLTRDGNERTHDVGQGAAHVATDPGGGHVLAGAGANVSRLGGLPDRLDATWNRSANGTVQEVIVRGDYRYAIADRTSAFDARGHELWTTASGHTVASRTDGRGLAVLQEGSSSGESTAAARQIHAAAALNQTTEIRRVSPGDVARVNVTVDNQGAAILNGTLAKSLRQGPALTVSPPALTINPGANATLTATLELPRDQRPGLLRVPVELETQPFVDVRGNLTVDVGRAPNVTARLEPGTVRDQAVVQGQQITVRLLVSNFGNADETVRLGARQTVSSVDAWPVTLDPSGTITVAQGSTTTVTATVTVPQAAPNGTTNQLVLRAASEDRASAAALTFTVNPFEAVELSPQTITKTMAPGASQSYTLTLANLGSVPANVTLDATALDDEGQAYIPVEWGVVLGASNIELAADATRTFDLEISAPPNVTSTQSVRVQLLATTDGGARASAIAFGVVDPALASDDDDDETPRREPLGVLAPLAGMALAAALIRRSHDGNL